MANRTRIQLLLCICFTGLVFASQACNEPAAKTGTAAQDSTTTSKQDTSSVSVLNAQPDSITAPSLSFLKGMNGKYFTAEKLFDNETLKARLLKLIGPDQFKFMRETWAVESTMSVDNNIFKAEGCMQHNCGSTNFIILANLVTNQLYAGIRADDQVTTYWGDNAPMPVLKAWSENKQD